MMIMMINRFWVGSTSVQISNLKKAARGVVGSTGLSLTTETCLLTKRLLRDDVYHPSLILFSLLLLWARNLPKMQQPDDKR